MGEIELATVQWGRAQFALTAMYHWLFVPITLGLSFLCAFFETIYVRTGDEEWKRLTKFWMRLFGINFAIGVATGIILEFEFGTNWSNYSWMMGDIFGAPLAIEGIFAFFLEATFFAVMFFGWTRVSKGFHLFSTWMVAVGSSLSALWILVANGWMQNPVGMVFNPETVRFEMENFWAVLFNPVAISKFTHATTSSFVVGACFVIMVSCWYLLRGRHVRMAKRSIAVAAVFGLVSSIGTVISGDESAYDLAQYQPMKLAAVEGLYTGEKGAEIVAIGLLNHDKKPGDDQDSFVFGLGIPRVLGLLATRTWNGFVPGIDDLVYGNEMEGIVGAAEKMERGKLAIADLAAFKAAVKMGNEEEKAAALTRFQENQDYMGYGYLDTPEEVVPSVPTAFYSFHYMVFAGTAIILVMFLLIWSIKKGTLEKQRWLQVLGFLSFPVMYLASEIGWVVAEVGRQPWAIEGRLLTKMSATLIPSGHVKTTFFIFVALFTILAIAEVAIMIKQINIGPEEN